MSIFKACDIRGRYGQELNPEVAELLGLAVGTELGGRAVVVGGDLRPSTEPLKEAVVGGLLATGCHVIDVGVLPTPALYFASDCLRADGGVMVTGSHNPRGDNGFKLSLGPYPITQAELASIERRMSSGAFARSAGTYEHRDVISHYEGFIKRKFITGSGLKVVIDAGNGCYARIAPDVLRGLAYQVVELHCEPDGNFPGRPPNPAVASNLQSLCEAVVRSEADLGAAFDGDGDRVVFVDERGRVVESDRAIVIFARHLLRRGPGDVVYDLKCSSVVPEEVSRAGGFPVMERSGHAFIRATFLRRGAVLGGEISGHFFFQDLGRDDGLYATLLMSEVVAGNARGLAALVDAVPRYPITPDIRLSCSFEESRAIIREMEQVFGRYEDCEVTTLDGVRVAWPDGWALVRPSVTEPLLTARFEARTETRLIEIQEMVAAQVPRLKELMS